MISPKDIKNYNAVRNPAARGKLCHAPFVSLNFEQNGNITACCFNRTDVLGKYPAQSIEQAWRGAALKKLRNQVDSGSLDGGCKLCKILLESGNYSGTKAIHYDEYARPRSLKERIKQTIGLDSTLPAPRVFEFEISNQCNLQCEMCNGYFSSTIRKNREKLPPIDSPYDDAFVEQVEHFLPELTDLKFLGGEPFLVDLYYKIWERVIEKNPQIRVHITTNGTIFNNRVREIMSKLKMGLVVSIDSIDKKEFEGIRKGANLERVLDNFQSFKELTQQNKTYLTIAACAMSSNWKGIPDLIRFANGQQVPIHFNVVWNPGHLSMRYMSYTQLDKVIAFYNSQDLKGTTQVELQNRRAFEELKMTVKHWREERAELSLRQMDDYSELRIKDTESLSELSTLPEMEFDMANLLLWHFAQHKVDMHPHLISAGLSPPFQSSSEEFNIRTQLVDVWKKQGDSWFFSSYFTILPLLAQIFYGKEVQQSMREKSRAILQHVQDTRRQQAILSDLIDDIDRRSVVNHLQLIYANGTDQLLEHIDSNY